VPKVDFTGFEKDADFNRLLVRYPLLRHQLQVMYGLTLEPGPDEARTWSKKPLFGFQSYPSNESRGRGRGHVGRSARSRGRGRGGRSVQEERPHGPWTQEKGDKEALLIMKKMQEGLENDELSEGLREFVTLCQIKHGSDRAGGQPSGEVS